jgi:PAS domain S-box-containing protein/putative nucleotidyltransferase with HDIG domain
MVFILNTPEPNTREKFQVSKSVWKKAVLFLVLLVIGTVAVSLIIYNNASDNNLDAFQQQQRLRVSIIAQTIDDDMSQVINDLGYFVSLVDGHYAFDNSGAIKPEVLADIQRSAIYRMGISRLYTEMVILDREGAPVLRIDGRSEERLLLPDAPSQYEPDGYFSRTLDLESNQVLISNIDLMRQQGAVVQPEKAVMRFAKVIRDHHGQAQGGIILYYDANLIFQRVRSLEEDTQEIMLLNSMGYWLMGPEQYEHWGFIYPERGKEAFGNYFPTVWKEMLNHDKGSVVTSDGSFVYEINYPVRLIGADIVTDEDEIEWVVVSRIPREAIASVDFNSLVLISMVSSVIALLVMVIILLITGSREAILHERDKLRRMYFNVIDTQQEMICRYLPDTTLTYMNDAYCRGFGKPREELLGHKYLMFLPPEKHEQEIALLKQLTPAKASDTREYKIISQDGSERWQEWTDYAIFNNEGELVEIQGFGRDITGRMQAEVALLNAYDETIAGWARALELKDGETKNHCQRVTQMTLRIAQIMGIKGADLDHLRRGAMLHDIGKMGIPDEILLKPGKLTDEEWELMRAHPIYAYDMLSTIEFLRPALDIPYCHHEKWDGSGYPRGLKGEEIPLPARIFAVVDVFDALSSDRPYRKAWEIEAILSYISESSGAHFDPQVVAVFMKE